MKLKRKWVVVLLVLLAAAAILFGGLSYINGVRNALWSKAVTDILEVTAQGRHALDTYLEKDRETLHLLALELAQEYTDDGETVRGIIRLFGEDGTSYLSVDLRSGVLYTGLLEEDYPLEAGQWEVFQALTGRGVREPYLDGRTGVRTLGIYERFTFADGAEGLVQKSQPLSEIADRFSLSFYHDTGFSYVVNREGDILVRSQHRNSNRTMQNLFDIIDLEGNDAQTVGSFRAALEDGKQGVARFQYQDEEYVFCYVPLESAADWYVVSIIPNRVIMEQAETIVQHSQILFLIILVSVLLVFAFFLVYRDSSRRVLRAEEEARRAAESANAAKSRFLSNMSHDIRTPMNAIISMTKLAEDHVEEPERIRDYLKNIGVSGQLLVGLINDILDMSKIESGKMVLNNDTASLQTLLSNLVKIVQPMVEKKGQQFDIRLHGVEHETLCFDALRLNQVLLNLLSNAVKFTPEGGSVSVDVTETPSRLENHLHYTFRVADTGIGMKPAFLEHLFDSFTREQDSRVNKTEGSGLGMAIAKMIVDMMNGSIQVESAPGKGTVFTVELDLLLPPELSRESLTLPTLRILVADDEPDTRRSAEKLLQELGQKADVVGSGAAAVEMAAAQAGKPYDLVLLDWKMPSLNGLETARALREGGCQTPIVLFSAYDWSGIDAEADRAGVTGFLQKPLFKSTLYHCILRYVLQEEPLTERQSGKVDLTGRRILLAEDNELNQLITRELLESVGAQLDVTENGLACVRRFEASAPGYYDLILMDIQMPVMNGYEAARHIRQLKRPDASLPIFAMTADAFAEDIEAAKSAGMNSHLAKPLDIPVMLREIQRHLKS